MCCSSCGVQTARMWPVRLEPWAAGAHACRGAGACARPGAPGRATRLRRELDVRVRLLERHRDLLELGVELGDPVLREQPQQVEPKDRILSLRLRQVRGAVGVVDLELRHVPLERRDVHRLDREQRAILEDLARHHQLLLLRLRRRRGRRGRQRGETKQPDLELGHQLQAVVRSVARPAERLLELVERLLHLRHRALRGGAARAWVGTSRAQPRPTSPYPPHSRPARARDHQPPECKSGERRATMLRPTKAPPAAAQRCAGKHLPREFDS